MLTSTIAFFISTVGDSAVGEEEADAPDADADAAAAAAAAAARVIRCNTGEPVSSTIGTGLLRRCRVPT